MAFTIAKHGTFFLLALALTFRSTTSSLIRRTQEDAAAQCASDAVLKTLSAQKDSQSFCSAYLPSALETVTALSITTVVVANRTVTVEQTSQPTLSFTVIADYETVTTTTATCAPSAVPGVAGLPALTTGSLPVGVGHGRVKGRQVAAPTAVSTPAYALPFQPSQISSACLCLVNVPPTSTTLQLATITSYADVLTTMLVNVGDIPIIDYVTFGATRKLVVTECV